MNKIIIFLISILITQTTFGQKKDNKEPSLKFDVEINGEKYQFYDGQSINIEGNEITIKSSENKTFDFGILSFDYPKHFAFEFESEIGMKNWFLDGNNLVISYYQFEENVTLDSFINELVSYFKKENCEIVHSEIMLGKNIWNGKRIIVNLLGQKLTYDLYKLDSKDSKTHFLGFQDSKNEDGSDSIEKIETLRLISNTIKIK